MNSNKSFLCFKILIRYISICLCISNIYYVSSMTSFSLFLLPYVIKFCSYVLVLFQVTFLADVSCSSFILFYCYFLNIHSFIVNKLYVNFTNHEIISYMNEACLARIPKLYKFYFFLFIYIYFLLDSQNIYWYPPRRKNVLK